MGMHIDNVITGRMLSLRGRAASAPRALSPDRNLLGWAIGSDEVPRHDHAALMGGSGRGDGARGSPAVAAACAGSPRDCAATDGAANLVEVASGQ
jgi:hypothetical protein